MEEPLERKVYEPWAFTDRSEEKGKINAEIYREITSRYKITSEPQSWNKEKGEWEDKDLSDYDLVYSRTPAYNHSEYQIIKNTTNLSQDEIALVLDQGNLCFGYMMEGSIYHIFED